MSYFNYQNGELNAERVPISRIASEVGTPFYCYSTSTIESHYAAFADALNHMQSTICYAVKANSNIAVVRTLAQLGAGADVVSDGELIRALEAGVPPKKIVFSGVGKTASELALALEKDILQINIESEPELERLNEVTQSLGKSAQVAFRINPNVDAGSHDKISTGRQEDKFGIECPKVSKVFSQATEMEYIEPIGLAVHIGSQLTDLVPFRSAFLKLHDLATGLMAEGFEIKRLDVGGGLGISYDGSPVPTSPEYAQLVSETLGDLNCDLLFEPGRVIIGDAGILVTKVIYVKKGPTRTFLIVDAAMNDFLRPSLYGAQHEILPIAQQTERIQNEESSLVDIVGPVCETGDKFATKLVFPTVNQEELLAIRSTGAYGAVMSSTYNSRALVPEVLVKDDKFSVIRERVGIDTLLGYENVPDWL